MPSRLGFFRQIKISKKHGNITTYQLALSA